MKPLPTTSKQWPTTPTGGEAAALENQADALEAEGARKEEAIDDADANAATTNAAEVNAM